MDDGRCYLASIISRFVRGEKKLQEARMVDMNLLVVCSTMTAISKWFAMIVCSAWVEN